MDGLGTITWWGFSPCIDLLGSDTELEVPSAVGPPGSGKDEINVLLLGCGDLRHWLKTVSRLHRKPNTKVTFYVMEHNIEVYARHALFLALILEDQHSRGLQEKTELFLEIFGNVLVRHHTAEYIQSMATELIKMVTNDEYMKERLPVLDVTQLKFKERDMLENIFKFWKQPAKKDLFDAEKCWDLRMRNYLGVRYDARKGAFDWDYSMKFCDRGAAILGGRTYSNWRNTGVAFGLREGTYDSPNRTLASVVVFKQDGDRAARRGYWGDIVISPYIAFGVESDEGDFFVKRNNELTKTSEDVSEYNVLSFIHELQTHERYQRPKQNEAEQAAESTESRIEELSDEISDVSLESPLVQQQQQEQQRQQQGQQSHYRSLQLGRDVSVKLLPLGAVSDLTSRCKYEKLFDVACISASMLHHLTPALAKSFAEDATIFIERAKYLIELNAKQCAEFDQKLVDIAAGAGCEPCAAAAAAAATAGAASPEEQQSFARYRYRSSLASSSTD